MRPLKVALIHRPGNVPGERNYGPWSYPVPEFDVTPFAVQAKHGIDVRLSDYRGFDLVVHEDGKSRIFWDRRAGGPPVAYVVTDSTLSEDHYRGRLAQAKRSDLVLVDWDRLERFAETGRPVRRFAYAVNDRRFYPRDVAKSFDVGVYANCRGVEAREEMVRWLRGVCGRRGWDYDFGTYPGEAYAEKIARTRVVVHLERTPTTRAHRVFDVMASGTALLTSPLPAVSGEEREAGRHYWEWRDRGELEERLGLLLQTGEWEEVAAAGAELAHRAHVWDVRARQLRATLEEVWPGIGQGEGERVAVATS